MPWADFTWNPIAGCSPISEGCQNCYAATFAKRFHRPWGKPFFRPSRLKQPDLTRRDGRVFVCSTSDLFHEDVPREWHEEIFAEMDRDGEHTFMLLTKRPERMALAFGGRRPPHNVWLGVTAENQARADERIPILLSIPAAIHFVSVEPMLGPVDLACWLHRDLNRVAWIICGPENGPRKRPCDPQWMADLEHQCAHVPFFDKRDPTHPQFTRRQWPL